MTKRALVKLTSAGNYHVVVEGREYLVGTVELNGEPFLMNETWTTCRLPYTEMNVREDDNVLALTIEEAE